VYLLVTVHYCFSSDVKKKNSTCDGSRSLEAKPLLKARYEMSKLDHRKIVVSVNFFLEWLLVFDCGTTEKHLVSSQLNE
jgi:hypothetical protein